MKYLFFSLFFIVFICNVYSQFDKAINYTKKELEAENIFVHTDKSNYIAGETIWMKAYVMTKGIPSSQKSSIKIQLITNDSIIIAEKIYPVINGTAIGNIGLPVNVKEDRYFIRAFTNTSLQKKYAKDFIASILIYNPTSLKKITDESFNYSKIPSVKFTSRQYLKEGVINQIYVSVSDQYHQPMRTEGYVINTEKDTITSFTTNSNGVAEIRFIPNSKHVYSFKLKDSDKSYWIHIPIRNNGTAMIVDYESNNYFIHILSEENSSFHLMGESNNQSLFNINVLAGQRIKIPVEQLPSGIFRIVLTDETNNIITESFLFSNNDRNIITTSKIAANINSNDTLPCNIHLQISDTSNTTTSVSLVDTEYDFEKNTRQENILNHFLLTAYLKDEHPALTGLIEDIKKADVQSINKILATDELLFPSWTEINSTKEETKNTTDTLNYIKIEGIIKPIGSKKLPDNLASINLVFEAADLSKNYTEALIDKEGKFNLSGLIFTDTMQLYYQLKPNTDRAFKVRIASTDPNQFFVNEPISFNFIKSYPPLQLNAANEKNAISEKQIKLFKEIVSGDTTHTTLAHVTVQSNRSLRPKTEEVNERYTAHSVFAPYTRQTYDFITFPYKGGAQNIIDYLKANSRNMTFVDFDELPMDLQLKNKLTGKNLPKAERESLNGIFVYPQLWNAPIPYTLFIDEQVVSFRVFKEIKIQNIALIKVFEHLIIADGNGPAIVVYTKHPEDAAIKATSSISASSIKLKGYNAAVDFINPEKQNFRKVNKSFFLGTYYWNTSIDASNQEINFDYYNLNKVKETKLIIQGMSDDGKLLYVNKKLQSK